MFSATFRTPCCVKAGLLLLVPDKGGNSSSLILAAVCELQLRAGVYLDCSDMGGGETSCKPEPILAPWTSWWERREEYDCCNTRFVPQLWPDCDACPELARTGAATEAT